MHWILRFDWSLWILWFDWLHWIFGGLWISSGFMDMCCIGVRIGVEQKARWHGASSHSALNKKHGGTMVSSTVLGKKHGGTVRLVTVR